MKDFVQKGILALKVVNTAMLISVDEKKLCAHMKCDAHLTERHTVSPGRMLKDMCGKPFSVSFLYSPPRPRVFITLFVQYYSAICNPQTALGEA